MIRYKCLSCKKRLTEDTVIKASKAYGGEQWFCQCGFEVKDIRNFFMILCPECGEKLEKIEDLRNAKMTCCPHCLTVIDL